MKKLSTLALALAVAGAMYAENRPASFYEGFEGRNSGGYFQHWQSNTWLPDGWTEFSKTDYHHNWPDIPDNEWDYTWCTKPSSGLYGTTPFGNCYAHIMVHNWPSDDMKASDEWLVTPSVSVQEGDVLYFYFTFNAWMTLHPDSNTHQPTFQGNTLEVRVSTDDGATWSDAVWSSYDYALALDYEEVYKSAISYNFLNEFRPVFIDLDDYYGKDVKFAFRYFGEKGMDIALDEVSVGIPSPKAAYDMPSHYFWPAITSTSEFPADPVVLAAPGVEDTWTNNSVDAKTFKWTYTAADGSAAVSEDLDLRTPAYTDGTRAEFPTLTAFYGENTSGEFSLVANTSSWVDKYIQAKPAKIQYGGFIGKQTDVLGAEGFGGVCTYNVYDPDFLGIKHMRQIALSEEAETAFDNMTTTGAVRDWDFLQSIGNVYPQPAAPYGIEYVYVNAIINQIDPMTRLKATVHRWERMDVAGVEGYYVGDALAEAYATWNPEDEGSGMMTSIMFDFSKTPVTVDSPIVVLITGITHVNGVIQDDIRFPYVSTKSGDFFGSSIMTFWDTYEDSETGFLDFYYELRNIKTDNDGHTAGILMGLGAGYSTMSLNGTDNVIECEAEGGFKTFSVKSSLTPDHWAFMQKGKALDWIEFEATATGNDNYDVKVTVLANEGADRNYDDICLAAPGSYVVFKVHQKGNSAGVSGAVVDENAPVEYFNLQGIRVENPSAGVYIRRQGTRATKVTLK